MENGVVQNVMSNYVGINDLPKATKKVVEHKEEARFREGLLFIKNY
jgi:hypothetical protein